MVDAPARPRVRLETAPPRRQPGDPGRKKGAGNVDFIKDASGYWSVRGRRKHKSRTYVTSAVGLGRVWTKKDREAAEAKVATWLLDLDLALRQGEQPDKKRERRTVLE